MRISAHHIGFAGSIMLRGCPRQKTLLFVGFLFILLATQTNGNKEKISIKTFDVPAYVELHDDVTLVCETNLPEILRVVSWGYKDQEFYKFEKTKGDEPKKIAHSNTQLNVDVSQSSETKVVLLNVTREATGNYTCLVKPQPSYFGMALKQSHMTVAVIPKKKPRIEPQFDVELHIGSFVEFNCTASPSFPGPELEWEINGEKAPEDYLTDYPAEDTSDGLIIRTLGLRFKVEKDHFVNSGLKLKCIARILSMEEDQKNTHVTFHQVFKEEQQQPDQVPVAQGELLSPTNRGVGLYSERLWLALNLAVALILSR